MAKFFYRNENKQRVYIKSIDYVNGTLEFTQSSSEAYDGRDGYYASASRDFIKRNFGEDYPQLKELDYD